MISFSPHPALRSRVQEIQVIESPGGEANILPAASAVLGFQYRGRVRRGEQLLSTSGVTGLQSGPRCYVYEPGTASVLVRFTAEGAACLGVPASQLSEQSLPLDAILPAGRVREASDRLLAASSAAARVHAVQTLLFSLPYAPDSLVRRAIVLLTGDRGQAPLSVAQVARTLSLSERQLERRFLQRVGVTPKRFATLKRFERVVTLAGSAPSLGQLAQAAGYYDQSHFIRAFRAYAGVPPGAVFRHLR